MVVIIAVFKPQPGIMYRHLPAVRVSTVISVRVVTFPEK